MTILDDEPHKRGKPRIVPCPKCKRTAELEDMVRRLVGDNEEIRTGLADLHRSCRHLSPVSKRIINTKINKIKSVADRRRSEAAQLLEKYERGEE